MDLRRFFELYVSESREHIRLLQRSLLALENDTDAVAEAFRAAHTLKGLSAAMGYGAVTTLAHGLEDRLEAIRSGRLAVAPELIDDLLEEADSLERAITASADTPPDAEGAGATPDSAVSETAAAGRPGTPAHSVLPGTVRVAEVRLRPDAQIKSARAMLVMRAIADAPGVLGSDPAEFGEEFNGDFRIFLGADADAAALQAVIAAAGEVESVELVEPGRAPAAVAAEPVAARTPTRQVRVDALRLDGLADGIGELSVLYARLPDPEVLPAGLAQMIDRMGLLLGNLQHDVLALRMVPVREAFERLPRVVRDAARSVAKEAELIIAGDDVELDRSILDEIGDPLGHLLRNAVDHGIERPEQRLSAGKPVRGRIHVRAVRERSSVRITVEDDGGGVAAARVVAKAIDAGLLPAGSSADISDEELFRLLSHPGLSTAEEVTAVSGRGVGIDVVVNRIRALGGAIDMHTTPGSGTRFNLRLPITLAVAQALRVRIGGDDYAIPLTHVAEVVELNGNAASAGGTETLQLREEIMPLIRMRQMLEFEDRGGEAAAVIAELGDRRAALAVDELVGREQILVKGFEAVAGMLPYFSGATILADGRPALVLDPLSVI